jgi:hypothetical protein
MEPPCRNFTQTDAMSVLKKLSDDRGLGAGVCGAVVGVSLG